MIGLKERFPCREAWPRTGSQAKEDVLPEKTGLSFAWERLIEKAGSPVFHR